MSSPEQIIKEPLQSQKVSDNYRSFHKLEKMTGHEPSGPCGYAAAYWVAIPAVRKFAETILDIVT